MNTKEKIKIALIGGGFITQFYKIGLEKSVNVQLVAIVDINQNCLAKQWFNTNFYTDYNQMIEKEKPNIVFVCIDTKNHYTIVKSLLESNISVIVEKPLCESMAEIEELYNIAKQNSVHLEVVYHFVWGDEAIWLKKNIQKFGEIVRYFAVAHEQYAYNPEHKISNEKLSLGNAWNDASINLLSVANLVVNLSSAHKTREIVEVDNSCGFNIYAHKTYENSQNISIDILVDYMINDKSKITIIDTTKGRLIIDHHEQVIVFNGKTVFKKTPKIHRMNFQYLNYFRNFKWDENNEQITKLLHKIMFL